MPTRACHPSAWHRAEAVCRHFFFVASDERPRQKNLVMATKGKGGHGSGKKQNHARALVLFFPQPSFDFVFPLATMPKIFCHALRARTCLFMFFPCGAKAKHSHKKKVPARIMAALYLFVFYFVPCGAMALMRGAGGRPYPFLCAPPIAHVFPRTPTHTWAGRG